MKNVTISLVLVFFLSCFSVAEEEPISVLMNQGGWCWYQDPRVIIHDGKLLIGSVEGNGSGNAVVGVFDLRTKQSLGRIVVHEKFDRDDHNSPVFYARPDGSVLTVYAKHNRDKTHYYRISDPGDPLVWGDEMTYEHDYPGSSTVTYMNLFPMRAEGKVYNFFRGIDFNPSFITSTDDGKTWNEPTHFIQSELNGRHRPYARYAGNGHDTIHVCFTDGHPRDFGNSVYYAAFREGNFFRSDGTLIKNLNSDGPLRPSEAELIFKGGGGPGRGGSLSALQSAWTSSIAIDPQGRPHLAYTLYISNTDHRYRVAQYDGRRWVDREVARAGGCLYDRESSYTGLISLDPLDPSTVVISTDVDPTTGIGSGGKHEIYRTKLGINENFESIRWKAVTRDSKVRNIRPVVVRDQGTRVIAWLRGTFNTYTDYRLDVVGIVEDAR
jgi:hypothetical protein